MSDELAGQPRGDVASGVGREVILRDLMILHVKLWLEGMKSVVLVPASILAAALDLFGSREKRGRHFYAVLRWGERFDLWLNLYGAAKVAETSREGLFAGSHPGDDSLLGKLEALQEPKRRSGAKLDR